MARAAVDLPITDLYFQFAVTPDWKIAFGQPVRITDKAYAIAGEEAGEERLGILWVRQDPTMRWIVERHAKASVCCRRNRGLSLQRCRDLTRHTIARVMAAEQGNAELPVLRDREYGRIVLFFAKMGCKQAYQNSCCAHTDYRSICGEERM